MKIYIDMIAFYLQKAGGITNVWKELLIRILGGELDIVLILQDTKCENIYFKQIMDFHPNVVLERGGKVRITRYLPVDCDMEKESGFISTYYRISRNKSIRQYVLVHDFTYEYYVKGIRKHVHSWQKKKAVWNADVVICVSKNTKKDLLKFYKWAKEKEIHIIYNGVNEVYRKLDNVGYINELQQYNNTPFLFYVGSRVHYKRFDFAVKIAGESGYGLVIIGGGALQKEEIKMLHENMGDNYLHISGISDETLNLMYNKAVALIYPSEYEGFGMPIVEAQMAGCPVIAHKGSAISEVIKDQSMLLENYSVQGAVKMINQLNDLNQRERIRLEGLESAKRFRWGETYKKYEVLFQWGND